MEATFIGYIAAVMTTAAFVPQVLKAWRTRSTESISLATFIIFTIGVFLWLVYGFSVKSSPMIVANSITLALSLLILWMKLRFK
jgi:MtN3 and saliva related transmembrane protein